MTTPSRPGPRATPTTSATQPANTDTVETVAGAHIQHGHLNRRIYLMKLGQAAPETLIPELERRAKHHRYTKIFAKVPRAKSAPFLASGYRQEAAIPRFYRGQDDALFLGRYLDPDRRRTETEKLDAVLHLAKGKAGARRPPKPQPAKGTIRACQPDDIKAMSEIYREVFPTYPFPIDQPDYLLATMNSHVVYFCVEDKGRLLALSSAEMDEAAGNVEMTDFATPTRHRGHGFAVQLLQRMEKTMQKRGITTAYTIARAISPGMNITFAKMNYQYGGRLLNNTNISGSIESMNIWYKHLA